MIICGKIDQINDIRLKPSTKREYGNRTAKKGSHGENRSTGRGDCQGAKSSRKNKRQRSRERDVDWERRRQQTRSLSPPTKRRTPGPYHA